ncbi:hypothetical protein GDO78_004198 [Eleutherodactylus coqui]|uniref:Uncharacterized protein n=1 Tax=Eleutherodactylus coqui TaxID=57060 RepID=A0A8J6ERD4_ELECQ|nr:hypothetical protein GDO78_004198 [Eleutherodactylus coqui]
MSFIVSTTIESDIPMVPQRVHTTFKLTDDTIKMAMVTIPFVNIDTPKQQRLCRRWLLIFKDSMAQSGRVFFVPMAHNLVI